VRIDIESADRVGITQEILAVFAKKSWNIKAMEVTPRHTFICFSEAKLTLSDIVEALEHVSGIIACHEIDLLPGERRSQYLDALLSKIPDAIIDIDASGLILVANAQAQALMGQKGLSGEQYISDFIDLPITQFLHQAPSCKEVVFNSTPVFADITPVGQGSVISGAVIVLQAPNRLGQQMSVVNQTGGKAVKQLVGKAANFTALLAKAQRFAQLGLPVLIDGETGTGKELLARAIHEQSQRASQPFLAINCAALPEHLLESELFGYAAGAFSGAERSGKAGLFEMAAGGTVFLDEIGEMSVYLQAKLLRFLQDFSFRRLGSTKEITVDVCLISATHRNLIQLVKEQAFREDLYYRLNVLNLTLPPLRERIDDISLLAEHFIAMAARQVGQEIPKISANALVALQQYAWPGNIRQLQNTLFRAVALSSKPVLEYQDVVFDQQPTNSELQPIKQAVALGGITEGDDWQSALANFEKQMLTLSNNP
jgi:transcriptional regulator of aromatic amino acid metabolism